MGDREYMGNITGSMEKELADALEELLSQISLLPGNHKPESLRNAYIQANNVLNEYHGCD